MNGFTFTITPFGENGFLATLQDGDTVARALAANTVASQLRAIHGVVDSVAGVESLVIRFRPNELSPKKAHATLESALHDAPTEIGAPECRIEIPVCYGGAVGPDFQVLCDRLSLSPEQMIELHSAKAYRVLAVGFAPGFAYLGPLPEALHTDRLSTPRSYVPAGSVGVAGAMTGIYPLASPGGWTLIGRTPKKLFDARAKDPFYFTPGAEVSFKPISADEFSILQESDA